MNARQSKVGVWASMVFLPTVPRNAYLENNSINSKRDWHGVLLLVKSLERLKEVRATYIAHYSDRAG